MKSRKSLEKHGINVQELLQLSSIVRSASNPWFCFMRINQRQKRARYLRIYVVISTKIKLLRKPFLDFVEKARIYRKRTVLNYTLSIVEGQLTRCREDEPIAHLRLMHDKSHVIISILINSIPNSCNKSHLSACVRQKTILFRKWLEFTNLDFGFPQMEESSSVSLLTPPKSARWRHQYDAVSSWWHAGSDASWHTLI